MINKARIINTTVILILIVILLFTQKTILTFTPKTIFAVIGYIFLIGIITGIYLELASSPPQFPPWKENKMFKKIKTLLNAHTQNQQLQKEIEQLKKTVAESREKVELTYQEIKTVNKKTKDLLIEHNDYKEKTIAEIENLRTENEHLKEFAKIIASYTENVAEAIEKLPDDLLD